MKDMLNMYSQKGNKSSELTFYAKLLQINQEHLNQASHSRELAETRLSCGRFSRILGQSSQAQSYLADALTDFRALQDVSGQARTLIELGYTYRLLGKNDSAFTHLGEARKLLRPNRAKYPDVYGYLAYVLGLTLSNLALSYRSTTCLLKSVQIAERHHLAELHTLALARLSLKTKSVTKVKRQQYREEAWTIGQKINCLDAQVLALYRWPTDTTDGFEKRQEAYHFANSTGSIELIILASNGLSNALYKRGKHEEACIWGEQALSLARQYGYLRQEALCLNDLSLIYRSEGQYSKAKVLLFQAVEIYKKIGSRSLAITLGNLGTVYKAVGEVDLALTCFQQSYEIHQRRKSIGGQCIQAGNIGTFYHALGQREKAEKWYLKSQSLTIGPDKSSYQAGNLASLYQGWGRSVNGPKRQMYLQKALNYSEIALEKSLRRKKRASIMRNTGRKASILLDLKRPREALPLLFQAYRLGRRLKKHKAPVRRLTGIARAYMQMGQPEMACKAATMAIKYALKSGWKFSTVLSTAYIARAKAWKHLGNDGEAWKDYKQSIDMIRKIYELFQKDETGYKMTLRRSNRFEEALLFCHANEWFIEAFYFMEAGRQPIYQRQLAITLLHQPTSIPQEWLEEEQHLLMQSNDLRVAILAKKQDRGEIVESYQALSEVRESLDSLWVKMSILVGTEEYLALRRAEPISFEQVKDLLI